eukprot:15481172-Alexandrium_andersonii.AAC.1
MLQSAPIRNPPCVKCKIASGVHTWSCAGPKTTSNLLPEAPEGCALRCFSRRSRICPRTRASRGSEGAKSPTRRL